MKISCAHEKVIYLFKGIYLFIWKYFFVPIKFAQIYIILNMKLSIKYAKSVKKFCAARRACIFHVRRGFCYLSLSRKNRGHRRLWDDVDSPTFQLRKHVSLGRVRRLDLPYRRESCNCNLSNDRLATGFTGNARNYLSWMSSSLDALPHGKSHFVTEEPRRGEIAREITEAYFSPRETVINI